MSVRSLALVLTAVLLLRGLTLGVLAVGDTTESRYYLVARHMARTGNWVTPYVLEDGRWQPYWGKPPLHFWLTALTFRLLGEGPAAARLPSFLAGAAMVLSTFLLGRLYGGGVQGLAAALLLATMVLFALLAGAVVVDTTFAATVTAALTAYAHHARRGGRPAGWGFFLFLGLGLLAKGPTALVLAGLPVGLWALVRREGREALRALPWLTGLALCGAVALPWYILAERATPGFLRYFLLNEHVYRYLRSDYGDLYGRGHEYFFGATWPMLAAGLLPWTPALLQAARRGRTGSPGGPRWYLWAWGLAPALFFTAARNLLISYLLPGLPALAVVGAAPAAAARWPRWLGGGLLLAAAGTAAAGALLGSPPLIVGAVLVGTLLLAWGGRRSPPFVALALATAWLLLVGPLSLAGWIDGRRSTAPLLREAARLLKPQDAVVFPGGPPGSAVVYAPARVDPARREGVAALLRDGRREVLALRRKTWERLPPAERRRLRLLAAAGLWVLVRESP